MPSDRETFFLLDSFVVIGHTAKRAFPKLTYGNLRAAGKAVFAVDLGGAERIEGDVAYGSVAQVPQPVLGAIVEVPKDEVMGAVQQVVGAGIEHLWIHIGCDTPEVLDFARKKGMHLRFGTCAVMYTQPGFSFHSIHKGIMKLIGKY